MEKIYIILPVHNRREITRRFIECLKIQTYKNFHLLLIDDGSTDGTAEMIQGQIQSITIIKGKGDWWWAGSLQQGYQWLKSQELSISDIVLIINDDTEFDPDFLEIGLELLKKQEKTLLLAQCYSKQNQQLIDAGVHLDWSRLSFEKASTPEQINCLSTRGLFLRVEDLFKIGGFHPKLLPHYLSDYEFTIRAHRKGMKLITDPSLKLWVDEEATGHHKLYSGSLFVSFRRVFSKKSAFNPIIWTSFIVLTCPWKWKILNLYRVWIGRVWKYLVLFQK